MRVLRRLSTPPAFARLTLVAAALLWVIVPSGAVVRLTASGLGCPDWPLCNGGVVPATAGHELIEYSNRLLSAVVVATAVLTAVVAWRLKDAPPSLRRWSLAIALASAAQAPLGAITVLTGLHPMAVGAHFLLSMIALACGTLLALRARDWAAGRERAWDRRRGPLAALVGLAAAVVLSTGAVVTAAGPHSGDDDVTERFGDLLLAMRVHVRAAVVFTVLAVVLVAWVWREGGVDRLTAGLSAVALPLVAIQIGLGEYQYRNGLPWEVVVFHVTTAGLLWAVVVAACWGVARPVRESVDEGRPPPRAAEPERVGAYRPREATRWQGTQRTESGSALSRPSGISAPQSTQVP
jgi:cytochrome c oxidase assembly protein subunit 15